MLSEVVTCNCVQNPGANAESNPSTSEEGVSFYLSWTMCTAHKQEMFAGQMRRLLVQRHVRM